MAGWQQMLYDKSPWLIRETLIAAEAWRRNHYRRYGNYQQVRLNHDLRLYNQLSSEVIQAEQLRRLNDVVATAQQKTDFYRTRLPETVSSLDELNRVPILTKADIRNNYASMIARGYNSKHLWTLLTSGSTGTPLKFSVGREGIRIRTALQDNYYALHDCHYGDRRVRFGGSRISSADRLTPPFWIYNRVDNQLQMSPYHLDKETFPLFVEKLNKFQPKYLTGYAHALYILGQHLCENAHLSADIRAIFLDSEGIPEHFVPIIEQGFHTQVRKTYGLGEVGLIALQASDDRYHVLDLTCVVEIVDDTGHSVPYGTPGRIIVTDLTQTAVPYIRYDTGDIGSLLPPTSGTNMNTGILAEIEGRSDDFIITPRGRKIGRLSHVTKPARGIVESQIVQTAADRVEIRVVPTCNFDQSSMREVINVAKMLLGNDMVIEWKIVENIPRTSKYKFRHVIREF